MTIDWTFVRYLLGAMAAGLVWALFLVAIFFLIGVAL